jgi:hypothetical protein
MSEVEHAIGLCPEHDERVVLHLDMKLQIELQGASRRLDSDVRGLQPGAYVLASIPPRRELGDASDLLVNGVKAVVRYIYNGMVFGFQTAIMGAVYRPARLLFLEYPNMVENYNLRSHARVPCFLPARMKLGLDKIEGAVVDLSKGGCQFRIFEMNQLKHGVLPTSEKEQIILSLRLPGAESDVSLNGKLKQIRKTRAWLAVGIGFNDLNEETRLQLESALLRSDLLPRTFDLELAVRDHTIWKSKLRLFLDGHDTLSSSEATSSKECALGHWLYAYGKAKYHVIPEINEMEGVHTDLHDTVKRIIEEKGRHKAKAEELFSRIDPLSDRIVSLLVATLQKITN